MLARYCWVSFVWSIVWRLCSCHSLNSVHYGVQWRSSKNEQKEEGQCEEIRRAETSSLTSCLGNNSGEIWSKFGAKLKSIAFCSAVSRASLEFLREPKNFRPDRFVGGCAIFGEFAHEKTFIRSAAKWFENLQLLNEFDHLTSRAHHVGGH